MGGPVGLSLRARPIVVPASEGTTGGGRLLCVFSPILEFLGSLDESVDPCLMRVRLLEGRAKVIQNVFDFLILQRIHFDVIMPGYICPKTKLIDCSVDRRGNDLPIHELLEVACFLVTQESD